MQFGIHSLHSIGEEMLYASKKDIYYYYCSLNKLVSDHSLQMKK